MNLNTNYTEEASSAQQSTAGTPEFDFVRQSEWSDGETTQYQGQIDITPVGSSVSDGWTLEMKSKDTIIDLWGADIVSRDGDTYLLSNAEYNASVEPNQKLTVGFIAEESGEEDPSNFEFNGESVEEPTSESPTPPTEEPTSESPTPPTEEPTSESPTPAGEPNPNFGGGQTYTLDIGSEVSGFDPSGDKIDLGLRSIHDHIPVQTENGFAMRFIWNPNNPDFLIEGVDIKDLQPENFASISDNHQRQDVSMVLAWEKGTAPVRSDAVYILGHQEGREQEISFDPQNQVLSMMYLNLRDNVTVEENAKGVTFTVLPTGQKTTLLGATFSSLEGVTVEARPGQMEDNFLGRMGFSNEVSNINVETYSREGIAVAGIDDPNSGYLYNGSAYIDNATGTSASHPQYNSGATNTSFSQPTLESDMSDHNHGDGGVHNHGDMSGNMDDDMDMSGNMDDMSETEGDDSLGIDGSVTGQGDDFDMSSGEDYGEGFNNDASFDDMSMEQGTSDFSADNSSDMGDMGMFGQESMSDNNFDYMSGEDNYTMG